MWSLKVFPRSFLGLLIIAATMSGFEVVGVILGGLPLIISCLEHYTNGVKKITAALGAVAEFKRVSRKLRAQEQVFRNTLELLILDCIDIGMQQVLMHDLGGQEWQRPEIEEALKSRLQKSYSTYAEHVKSIEQSILKLRESLHIDEHGKVSGMRENSRNRLSEPSLTRTGAIR